MDLMQRELTKLATAAVIVDEMAKAAQAQSTPDMSKQAKMNPGLIALLAALGLGGAAAGAYAGGAFEGNGGGSLGSAIGSMGALGGKAPATSRNKPVGSSHPAGRRVSGGKPPSPEYARRNPHVAGPKERDMGLLGALSGSAGDTIGSITDWLGGGADVSRAEAAARLKRFLEQFRIDQSTKLGL